MSHGSDAAMVRRGRGSSVGAVERLRWKGEEWDDSV